MNAQAVETPSGVDGGNGDVGVYLDAGPEQPLRIRATSIVLMVHSETRAAGVTSVTAALGGEQLGEHAAEVVVVVVEQDDAPRGRAPASMSSGVSTSPAAERHRLVCQRPTPSARQRAPVATAT